MSFATRQIYIRAIASTGEVMRTVIVCGSALTLILAF